MKTNMHYWEDVLNDLPDLYRKWFKEEKDYLQKVVQKDSFVLEIGCGDGRSIYDLLPVTTNIVGIDHDDKAVVDAGKNFSDIPSIKIIKEDARELSFKDETFDFVLCLTTFANFGEDKFKILNEMKRVLKSTGKIIISVFSEDALSERMKVYAKINLPIKSIENGNVTFDESLGAHVSEQFSKEQLEDIFSKVGLTVFDMTKLDIAYLCTLTK